MNDFKYSLLDNPFDIGDTVDIPPGTKFWQLADNPATPEQVQTWMSVEVTATFRSTFHRRNEKVVVDSPSFSYLGEEGKEQDITVTEALCEINGHKATRSKGTFRWSE